MPREHTPGPWYVGTRPEYDVDQITADHAVGGPTGRDEYDHESGVWAVVDGEPETLARPWSEADAHMISAAPDLLSALIDLMDRVDVLIENTATLDAAPVPASLVENARRAIAKAIGEPATR